MGRFVPVNLDIQVAEKTPSAQPGAKVYYDGKQCWQYKAVYKEPGAYTWTAPAGITCARSVLIGGGGKAVHQSNTCCSFGGAGGAYSEKCMAVGSSTSFCIIVGKQEQDSTLSCNGTPVHTAGGATCCTPGTATGGDWNSCGGNAGYSCNHCGGSYSHHCGSCTYITNAACCGYCIIYAYKNANEGASNCCNMLSVGGASAGSPKHVKGGNAQNACGYRNQTAAGGAGIGDFCRAHTHCGEGAWWYNCCHCVCIAYCTAYSNRTCYPPSLGGGGGSKGVRMTGTRGWEGQCDGGIYRTGDGGSGGPEGHNQVGFQLEWGYHQICAYPYGAGYQIPEFEMKDPSPPPQQVDWWDISDICGSGAPGAPGRIWPGTCECMGAGNGSWPENSGEGAGTGGTGGYEGWLGQAGMNYGSPQNHDVNWCLVCHLGEKNWESQAYKLQRQLVPSHITYAGTLGGSGGTNWCHYNQKAGAGGGAGQSWCHIVCVCYGGSYDLCNGSGPALAFSPCLLDSLVSNAGEGMAIIYYKET